MKLQNRAQPRYRYNLQWLPLPNNGPHKKMRLNLVFLVDFGAEVQFYKTFHCGLIEWDFDVRLLRRIRPCIRMTVPNVFEAQHPLTVKWKVIDWFGLEKEAFNRKIPLLRQGRKTLNKLKELLRKLQLPAQAEVLQRLEAQAKQQEPVPPQAFNATFFARLNASKNTEDLLLAWLQHNPVRANASLLDALFISIARLEKNLDLQLEHFYYQPAFQQFRQQLLCLRGISSETHRNGSAEMLLRVEIINAREEQVAADFANSTEVEASKLYQILHHQQRYLEQNPPSLLICNYEFGLDNFATLKQLAALCDVTKTVLVGQVSPSMFELDNLAQLSAQFDFEQHFAQPKFHDWQQWRQSEAAQNIVLMVGSHRMVEDSRSSFLCPNSWLLAQPLMCVYEFNEWFYSIEGRFELDVFSGGVFQRNSYRQNLESVNEVAMPRQLESKLNAQGFSTLADIAFTDFSWANCLPTLNEAVSLDITLNKNLIIHGLFCLYQNYIFSQRKAENPNYGRTKLILIDWLRDVDNRALDRSLYDSDTEIKSKPWRVLDCDYNHPDKLEDISISAVLSLRGMLDRVFTEVSFALDLSCAYQGKDNDTYL